MDADNDGSEVSDNIEAAPNEQNKRRDEDILDDEDVSSVEIPPTPHTSRRPLPVGGLEEEEVEATPIPQPHRSLPRGGLRINTSSDVLNMALTPTSSISRRNFDLPTAPFSPVDNDDDDSEPHTALTPLSLTSFESRIASSPQEEDLRRDRNDVGSMGSPQHGPNPNIQHEFPQQQHAVIWGTDVNVPSAARAFKDFILTFRSVDFSRRMQQREDRRQRRRQRRNDEEDTYSSSSDDDYDEELLPPIYYLNQLSLIHTSQPSNPFVDIDTLCLYYHNAECQRLYHQLVKYPQEIVPIMDMMINQAYQENFILTEEDQIAYNSLTSKIQVRPFNLRHLSQMRALDPLAIDTLLSLQGMVVRCSPLVPDLKIASFICQICGHVLEVTVDRGKIAEPTQCNTCLKKNSHKLIHNRSIYSNKQVVRLQETPDEVPAGETPASIVMLVYDNLVDGMRPGDRVSKVLLFFFQN
jgi:hypothetical protein